VLHPAPCLHATNLPPLLFAGDAFDGAKVEGAFLSGRRAAEQMLALI
jgi:predicted NAD/FAD-dependent oxidoreductase